MRGLTKAIQDSIQEQYETDKTKIISLGILFSFFLISPFMMKSNSSDAIQLLILGIVLSALYAILALGFSLIYGVAKQFKLSLGGYYVVGAYTMFFLLETIKISPTGSKFSKSLDSLSKLVFYVIGQEEFPNLDVVKLLALSLLPLIFVIGLLAFFWTELRINEFLFILGSALLAGGSVIILGGSTEFVEGFCAALAVLALGFVAWYLELPRREVVMGTFILGLIVPIMIVTNLPVIYCSLAVLAILFTAVLAAISDRYLLDNFRSSEINTMIVTFSVALLIQSIIQMVYFPKDGKKFTIFGPDDHNLETIIRLENIDLLGASIENIRLLSLVLFFFACVLLYAFIWFSKMGMALRAVSQDEEAAALAGVDIRKTTAIVSGIGMGLVAFAAVFTSSYQAAIWNPYMGWTVLLVAIAVVILGGMGSLPGSIVAAFIMGFSEVLISSTQFSDLSVVIPLSIVLITMIFKPEGLFGEKKELES